MADRAIEKKRLDQYKRFLDPTLADDQLEYYGPIRPLIGPELSVAVLEKEDMYSYILQVKTAQEMAANGQDDLLMLIQTTMTSELKLSMSREGTVVDHIFGNKMEYSQTQTLHEYQHPMEKKRTGLFGPKTGGG